MQAGAWGARERAGTKGRAADGPAPAALLRSPAVSAPPAAAAIATATAPVAATAAVAAARAACGKGEARGKQARGGCRPRETGVRQHVPPAAACHCLAKAPSERPPAHAFCCGACVLLQRTPQHSSALTKAVTAGRARILDLQCAERAWQLRVCPALGAGAGRRRREPELRGGCRGGRRLRTRRPPPMQQVLPQYLPALLPVQRGNGVVRVALVRKGHKRKACRARTGAGRAKLHS